MGYSECLSCSDNSEWGATFFRLFDSGGVMVWRKGTFLLSAEAQACAPHLGGDRGMLDCRIQLKKLQSRRVRALDHSASDPVSDR